MNDTNETPAPAVREIKAKNEKGEERILRFENHVVPGREAQCAGWTFEEDADFSGLIFEGEAEFENAVFKGRADFLGALFKAQVNFKEALFERDAVFVEARFSKEGSGRNNQHVTFERCRFGIGTREGGEETTQPEAHVDFRRAKFHNKGDVQFWDAQFHNKGDVSFEKAQFHNKGVVWFEGARFYNAGRVFFWKARFHHTGGMSFFNAQFHNTESVSFDNARFHNTGVVNLSGLVFGNDGFLTCWGWRFREGQEIDFNHCLFLSRGMTWFNNLKAPANGQLRFTKCLFALTEKVDFSKSQFKSTVFEGGKFDPEFKWDSLDTGREDVKELVEKIQKNIKNKGEYFCEVFDDGIEVDFTMLSTESAQNLTFRLTSLSGVRFDGLTLSHVQLNAPHWAEYEGRVALCQEITLRKNRGFLTDDEYRDLSDQYTQLKINLERQGHYRDSGKFHISEQELTRDYNWKHGKYHVWFLHSLYKWLSGYGEQPFRSIICFVLLLLFFSTVISTLTTDFSAVPYAGWEWGEHGFVKVLKTGLSLITPFKGLWFEHMTVDNYPVYIVRFLGQVSILAIQLPLMILAIRRWFKR